ncbi:hypothetical protein AtNW77_Chr1g0040961 [Arabidopsis thaliana]
MSSAITNHRPYHGSIMSQSSQAPSYSSTPMGNETNTNVGATEFPEFSTQMALGVMSGVHETIPNEEDLTCNHSGSSKWTTDQNLVLLSRWIKYEQIVSLVETKKDNVKRMQQSGWSKDGVLAKAHELYSNAVEGNTGSGSSGSKRTHESDVRDANSVGSSARPIGSDIAKKKTKKKDLSSSDNYFTKRFEATKKEDGRGGGSGDGRGIGGGYRGRGIIPAAFMGRGRGSGNHGQMSIDALLAQEARKLMSALHPDRLA